MSSLIKCSICNGKFDGIDEFARHLTTQHDMGSSPAATRYLAFLEKRIMLLEDNLQK
jgi:hypothetical protein